MSNPTTIVQLADVKAHLNITINEYDVELRQFIDAATPVIEKIAGPVIVQTVTEYFNGGEMAITLNHLPVISITSITETNGDTATALTAVTLGSGTSNYGYTFDPVLGKIVRRVGNAAACFAPGVANVKVVYSAGRATIPGNIRLATLELIAHWWQRSQTNRAAGRPTFGGEDGAAYVGSWMIPNGVRELLQPDPDLPGIA